jgi:hypothetical protein
MVSSHSIKVKGTLEIPLELHGVILHLRTRLPTDEELALYRDGQCQSVQLTDDTTWEPYSKEFAQRGRGGCCAHVALSLGDSSSPQRH